MVYISKRLEGLKMFPHIEMINAKSNVYSIYSVLIIIRHSMYVMKYHMKKVCGFKLSNYIQWK